MMTHRTLHNRCILALSDYGFVYFKIASLLYILFSPNQAVTSIQMTKKQTKHRQIIWRKHSLVCASETAQTVTKACVLTAVQTPSGLWLSSVVQVRVQLCLRHQQTEESYWPLFFRQPAVLETRFGKLNLRKPANFLTLSLPLLLAVILSASVPASIKQYNDVMICFFKKHFITLFRTNLYNPNLEILFT